MAHCHCLAWQEYHTTMASCRKDTYSKSEVHFLLNMYYISTIVKGKCSKSNYCSRDCLYWKVLSVSVSRITGSFVTHSFLTEHPVSSHYVYVPGSVLGFGSTSPIRHGSSIFKELQVLQSGRKTHQQAEQKSSLRITPPSPHTSQWYLFVYSISLFWLSVRY